MSELIPEIYFNFLRGASPEPLVPVFLHNQLDLRGLAALAGRGVGLLADAETKGRDAFELYGVSRICERRGEAGRARRLYERTIRAELPPEADRAARSSLARLAKREGNLAQAREIWEGLLGASKEGMEAYEQLAMYYEHRAREPHEAAAIVRRALVELRKSNRLGMMAAGVYRRVRERFEHRLARLERSLGKSLLDAMETAGGPKWPESPREPRESN
jgi:tetratricopeptide (TPR) repeat protein